jgi:hypothetical protein
MIIDYIDNKLWLQIFSDCNKTILLFYANQKYYKLMIDKETWSLFSGRLSTGLMKNNHTVSIVNTVMFLEGSILCY